MCAPVFNFNRFQKTFFSGEVKIFRKKLANDLKMGSHGESVSRPDGAVPQGLKQRVVADL